MIIELLLLIMVLLALLAMLCALPGLVARQVAEQISRVNIELVVGSEAGAC